MTKIDSEWYCNGKSAIWLQKAVAGDNIYYTVTGGLKEPWSTATTTNQTISVNWMDALSGSRTATGIDALYYTTVYGLMAQNKISIPNIARLMDYEETPEQKAERQKQYAEREAKRKAAECRAENLLFTILTPSQVRQYKDDRFFETNINGRIYRLHSRSRSRNVELIEAGKPTVQYCAHPGEPDLPIPDVLVSQFLMLQSNEAEFLRIANRTMLM